MKTTAKTPTANRVYTAPVIGVNEAIDMYNSFDTFKAVLTRSGGKFYFFDRYFYPELGMFNYNQTPAAKIESLYGYFKGFVLPLGTKHMKAKRVSDTMAGLEVAYMTVGDNVTNISDAEKARYIEIKNSLQ